MFTALLGKAKLLGILGVIGGGIALAAPSASAKSLPGHTLGLSRTVSHTALATPVCYRPPRARIGIVLPRGPLFGHFGPRRGFSHYRRHHGWRDAGRHDFGHHRFNGRNNRSAHHGRR